MERDQPCAALELDNLRKTYAGGVQALKGISLRVEAGDFFALLGPNGAGKSTTIGIVSSLVNKSAGRVRVFGHDLDRAPALAKSMLGLVPQEFNFNQFETVLEILLNQAGYYGIPRPEARQRARRYLHELGLWEKRHSQARDLSGGMKRRLMIARALIHEPRLLILDEPTAGVDIEIRRSMWSFLRRINAEGRTIILTTHYLEEAESLCRNIAIINGGEIASQGSMRELLAGLHVQHFMLDVDRPLDAVPDLGAYPVTLIEPRCLEVTVDTERDLSGLFRILTGQGIRVVSMRNRANRLEEVFMHLVEGNSSKPASDSRVKGP